MCKGFGGLTTKGGKLYFTEPDSSGDCSHATVIERLKIKDNTDIHNRNFVRWQFPDWKEKSFVFDEEDTLPGWAEDTRDEITNKAMTLLGKVKPAWAEYEKVRQPALDEYEKVKRTAWAEYEKVQRSAWAEYEKVRQSARAELIVQLSKYPEYVLNK